MHFCLTGQYTPRALNAILENPTTNRQEAATKLIEAAGGKLISMYSVAADGPGVLVIFDVPDPSAAPAISGLTVTAGTLQNVKLTRLFTQDEIKQVRQNAAKLRSSYIPPEADIRISSDAAAIVSGGGNAHLTARSRSAR
ncbi:GYD domain-containing protein [Bradyrhizobium japonicum]